MRVLMLLLLSIGIVGCSSELKAPCDYQGHFCGQKIKINQSI